MSLNVVMKLPIRKGKGHVFSFLVLNPVGAVLELREQYGCPKLFAPENDFSPFSVSLN